MKKFLALFMTFCMGMSTVAFAAAPSVTYVHAGDQKSYAVLSDGTLYTWGEGRQYNTLAYQAGDPVRNMPKKTDSGVAAAGETSTMWTDWTIKIDGSYWYGSQKLLKNAVSSDREYILCSDGTLWKREFEEVSKVIDKVKDFSSWGTMLAIVKNDGSVWLMGDEIANPYGGKAAEGKFYKLMDGANDVIQGQSNLFVLKTDGSLWGWGANDFGQLGQGHKRDLEAYTAYHIMDDVASIQADYGASSLFAIKEDDSLWVWGNGDYGKLGLGTNNLKYSTLFQYYIGSTTSPTKLMEDVVAVSSNSHTLILKKDGSLWACGDNQGLAVGDGAKLNLTQWGDHSQDRLEPVKISLGVATGGYTEPSRFVDVLTGAYYQKPVDWAVEKNITSGTISNTFSPDQTCTRGQIITFLWRAAGSPAPRGTASFTDVDQNMYYARAVAWAAEKGMADGARFNPDAPCTREMAVEFMWKYAGSPDAAKANFADVSAEAVDWAVAGGITSGTSATTFSPDQTCTRGQIVTFLYRGFGE